MKPSLCLAVWAPLFAALAVGPPRYAAGQDPEPPEEQRLEEAFVESLEANGPSHASGARPELGPSVLGNPTTSVVALRVGLYYPAFNAAGAVTTEFSTLNHPKVSVSATVDTVHVIDGATGRKIEVMHPGVIFDVSHDGTGFQVGESGQLLGTWAGPVLFLPTTADEQLRVESIRRTNILQGGFAVPRYRGALEVARGPATTAGRVNLVNIVELESYVPGVVANESIASFHMEALKAQATAARGYAVANIGRFARSGWPFDIVDSSASQVYRGIISEHARAVQSSAETRGLVGSYQGRIISALYSSSFGGHSDSNEWIFNSPSNVWPGTNAEPYLRSVFDGPTPAPDFTDPVVFDAFWKAQQPATYDSCASVTNRFSRWKLVIPAVATNPVFPTRGIKPRLSGPPVRYVVVPGSPANVLSGSITDVQVVRRMTGSQRAAIVRVSFDNGGAVDVRGWDNIRNVFGRTVATPSTPLNCGSGVGPDFTLNNPTIVEVTARNANGTVKEVTAWGGGWGHNVGLSQFGSNGRARAGQGFLGILNAYYTGVDVGSYPIDIGREPGSGPPTLRQSFQTTGAGTLEVRATGLKGLIVTVNELDEIRLTEEDLATRPLRVDLTPYLSPGVNVVQYNPVGRNGRATVAVIVD